LKKILLVCGAGISSSFLASRARKAAKERKLDYDFMARSDMEVKDHADIIDLLLVGPHKKLMVPTFEKELEQKGVPVKVLSDEIYGMIDGEALVDYTMKIFEEEK
jgi:cellobiose-specific phosphotransferase system component IIB